MKLKCSTENLFKSTVNGYNRKQVNEYIRQLMNEMELINQKCQKEIMNFKVQNKELKNVFQFRLEEKDKVIHQQSEKIHEIVKQLDDMKTIQRNPEDISNDEYKRKVNQLQEQLKHSETTKVRLNQELLSKTKELERFINKASNTSDVSSEELKAKELDIAKLQQSMEGKEQSILDLNNRKQYLENEIHKRDEEIQHFKAKFEELSTYEQMNGQLKEENELIEKQITDLNELISAKDSEIEELNKNTEELIQICNVLKERVNEYETNKDKITNALIRAQEKADTIVEEAKIESTILKSKIQVEIDKKNQELKAVESEVNSLQENIVEVLERYQFLLKDIKSDDTKVSKIVKM